MTLRKGFTLIELLVVVAIIGILITIAVPRFTSMTNGAKEAAIKDNQRQMVSAVSLFMAANDGALPTAADKLDPYLPKYDATTAKDFKGAAATSAIDALANSPSGAEYKFDYDTTKKEVTISAELDGREIITWTS